MACALLFFAAVALVVYIAFATGLAGRFTQRALVRALEQRTGGRVEMKGFRFHPWTLRAEIDDLTLHGLEGPTAAATLSCGTHPRRRSHPLVVRAEIFPGRIDHRAAASCDSNRRSRATAICPSRSLAPALARGKKLCSSCRSDASSCVTEARTSATGASLFQWSHAISSSPFITTQQRPAPIPISETSVSSRSTSAERRDMPFAFDLSGKFTLHRDSFELDQLAFNLPHSELNLRAELPSFARSDWNLRYRGRLSLEDVRTIFRSPTTPGGVADFSGQAHYAGRPVDRHGLLRRPRHSHAVSMVPRKRLANVGRL